MKIPDTTHYSLETFLLEKTPKPLRKGHYQVLSTNPCAAKLQGADSRSDICVTSKEGTKPWLKMDVVWWPETKTVKKQTASERDSFPQND